MTTAEMNRDIKKLAKRVKSLDASGNDPRYYEAVNEIKEEANRLYKADPEMKYMNAYSIKVLLNVNVRFRFEAFHYFGANIAI